MAERTSREEIIYTTTEDGVILAGLVVRPDGGERHPLGVVWVHGLTGQFYLRMIVTVSRALAEAGYVVVSGNNRGRDLGALEATAWGEPKLAGALWERFDESAHDVAAWVELAAGLGLARVALVGHSLGALKAVYYQSQRQDPRIAGVVAASPPTRRGRWQPEVHALAQRLVAEGNGHKLLPWGSYPVSGTLSAQSYLDQFQAHVDVFGFSAPEPAVARLRCPLLAFYGGEEPWVGTAADLETIRRHARQSARVETRLFAGADHLYVGHEAEVAATLAEWLGTL